MTTIIEDRLKALDSIPLLRGPHDPNDDKQCVSPVLATFVRAWNDALDDEERQTLKPHIPRMIGTAGDDHDEERAWMAADWLVRVCTPAWLDLAGINDSAEALRSLPPITETTLIEAEPTVTAARDKAAAARNAIRAGVGKAASDAAWDAALDAAWDATWNAAWAAVGAAPWNAAWAAIRDAAWAAVRAAAWAAALEAKKQGGGSGAIKECFEPVKAELHRSAHELLDRMIDGPFGKENTHE